VSGSARYPIPACVHRVEETIRRSRFVTTVAHAPDSEAARAFVETMRDEFPDATHNCWAFVAGPPGSTTHVGMSDDGEPHGTAGRPMLTTLLHGGVGEIVAVTSRWFGGVKLGTGGLGRAYAGGVKLALATLPTEERVERVPVRVVVDYRFVDGLQRLVSEHDVVLQDEAYGAEVCYTLAVPAEDVADFARVVADLTGGEGGVEIQGDA
jgi:uncharacterized YigZ family protein